MRTEFSQNIFLFKTQTKKRFTKPAFKAHPDFYKYNSTLSCYFRRGAMSLSNKGYVNIENLFYSIFNSANDQQKNMLIIGIGHSQEPFSYLASIKGILKDRPLNKHLDLSVIDLQSMPEKEALWHDSFCDLYDYQEFPKYAKKCFVKDKKYVVPKPDLTQPAQYYFFLVEENKNKIKHSADRKTDYRVNDEIFNFLYNIYNNPQKAKWDTRVQEEILNYPDEKFDIISANNVLPYIDVDYDIINTIKHIKRTLKKGGYFITDPYNYPKEYIKAGVLDNLKELFPGIYQKI